MAGVSLSAVSCPACLPARRPRRACEIIATARLLAASCWAPPHVLAAHLLVSSRRPGRRPRACSCCRADLLAAPRACSHATPACSHRRRARSSPACSRPPACRDCSALSATATTTGGSTRPAPRSPATQANPTWRVRLQRQQETIHINFTTTARTQRCVRRIAPPWLSMSPRCWASGSSPRSVSLLYLQRRACQIIAPARLLAALCWAPPHADGG